MFQSYQIAPIDLRPVARPSTRNHSKYLQIVDAAVSALRLEKEVIDGTNVHANVLLQTMDAILSHGLISGNKAYWIYVREFLPKNEQRLMETECLGGFRKMSVQWLKDSFNRSCLHFQLLAFLSERSITRRFYHSASVLRNYGVFELIVMQIGKLDIVQFAFDKQGPSASIPVEYAPEEEHPVEMSLKDLNEPVSIVYPRDDREDALVVNGKREDVNRRRDVTVPPPSVPRDIAPTNQPIDDGVLNELVRHKRGRVGFFYDESESSSLHDDQTNGSPVEDEKPQEKFDDVIRKTMSETRMTDHGLGSSLGHIYRHPPSFIDERKLDEEMRQREEAEMMKEEPEDEPIEGEVVLHSGEVLRFVMDVFVDTDEECERFQKLFHVYDGETSSEKARLLLVTDRNLYLLTQVIEEGNVDSRACDIIVSYTTHVTVPLPVIEFIEVSHGGVMITLHAVKGKEFVVNEGGLKTANDRILGIITGSQKLGAAIVDTIAQGVKSIGGQPPTIYYDKSPFDIILKRYLTSLRLESTEIRVMTMAFWGETPRSISADSVTSSYFISRELSKGWFANSMGEWEQNYFVLRDNKLYVFADSECRKGRKIIDLCPASKEGLKLDELTLSDHPNIIRLDMEDAFYDISFPSVDEKQKWLNAITAATFRIPEAVLSACTLIITDSNIVVGQFGSNVHVDGFVRTLANFKVDQLRECLFYTTYSKENKVDRSAVLMGVEDQFQWFFVRFADESTILRYYLSTITNCYDIADFPERDALGHLIELQTAKFPNIWGVRAYVTGNDALSEEEEDEGADQ